MVNLNKQDLLTMMSPEARSFARAIESELGTKITQVTIESSKGVYQWNYSGRQVISVDSGVKNLRGRGTGGRK